MRNQLKHSLDGIRVLDLSRVLAGPWAGQTLADLGADVIKIEHPDQHDETRFWGPPFWNGHSAYYLSCNRGKRALALDLKHPEGRATLYDLVKTADILIENFRTSSLSELGITPAQLHAVQPNLIICSVSGFGRTGSMADIPGYDFVIQGLSGMMAMNGAKSGEPTKFGVAIADLFTGHNVVIAALAGLQYRQRTGVGLHADIALADSAVASMANVVQSFLVTGRQPERQGNEHLQIVPYQAFKTADSWLVVAVGNDRQWQSFCKAVDRSDLAKNERYTTNAERVTHRQELTADLKALFLTSDTGSWLVRLESSRVPAGKVFGFEELFASELAKERNYRVEFTDHLGRSLDLMASPLVGAGVANKFPPLPGQQTEAILLEIPGYTAERIQKLRDSGAIK